ncbi:MAG: DUF444 family protein [Candidatus Nanohaloarchaea archaeon]|nr:DUF444 family protein [Candidatus Nanohaloarchaea archaeon]
MKSDRMRKDVKSFKEVGENRREDLKEFIKEKDLSDMHPSKDIKIPIKELDLPVFDYSLPDQGRVGKGEGEAPEPGDIDPDALPEEEGDESSAGNEEGEEKEGEHYYEMTTEEAAEILREEIDLDLEDKGKEVVEEKEGKWTDVARKGSESNLDMDRTFEEAIVEFMSRYHDENFMKEALKVEDKNYRDVFDYLLKEKKANISEKKLRVLQERIDNEELDKYSSFEELEENVEYRPVQQAVPKAKIPIKDEHKRYRQPEIIEEERNNVVVVHILDKSGSMGDRQRDLVERTFKTLDVLINDAYEFVKMLYITHDADATLEDSAEEFYNKKSSGGTKISSGYKKAKEVLDSRFPWNKWNRYIFGAGDGDNWSEQDTDKVIDLMNTTPANLHGYVQVQSAYGSGEFGKDLELFKDNGLLENDTGIAYVDNKEDILPGVKEILEAEGETTHA